MFWARPPAELPDLIKRAEAEDHTPPPAIGPGQSAQFGTTSKARFTTGKRMARKPSYPRGTVDGLRRGARGRHERISRLSNVRSPRFRPVQRQTNFTGWNHGYNAALKCCRTIDPFVWCGVAGSAHKGRAPFRCCPAAQTRLINAAEACDRLDDLNTSSA